jgi:hypothetical protein
MAPRCISCKLVGPGLCPLCIALIPHVLPGNVRYLLLDLQPAMAVVACWELALCCSCCVLLGLLLKELLPEMLQLWIINHAWR